MADEKKQQPFPWGCFLGFCIPAAIVAGLGLGFCARETPDEAREKSERELAKELGRPYVKHFPSGDGSTSPQKFIDENLNGIQEGYSAKFVNGWIRYYVPAESVDSDLPRNIYNLAMQSGVSSKDIEGVEVYYNSDLADTTKRAVWNYESWDE